MFFISHTVYRSDRAPMVDFLTQVRVCLDNLCKGVEESLIQAIFENMFRSLPEFLSKYPGKPQAVLSVVCNQTSGQQTCPHLATHTGIRSPLVHRKYWLVFHWCRLAPHQFRNFRLVISFAFVCGRAGLWLPRASQCSTCVPLCWLAPFECCSFPVCAT